MKHIVKLTLSNPSHEHVSMRMRTKQQDYITEGRDESEAINRATRHFRTLGFKVHSAVIVEQKVEIPEPVKAEPVALSEAVDYKALEKPTIMRIKSGETKPVDRTNYNIPTFLRKKADGKKPIDKKAALEAFIARRKETSVVTEEAAPQYIEEKLTAADPASKWIHDFVHSDNPKFAGKSKKERIQMALGAKYGAMKNEEVEQVDEQSPSEIKAKYYHDQFDKVKPVKAYDKEGKLVGHYRSMAHAKQMKPGHTYKMAEEVEQVDEANLRFDPEAPLHTTAPVVKNWQKSKAGDPRAKAAWAKHVRRMQKVEPTGMTKKDIESHMQSHFGEEAEQVVEADDPGATKVVNKAVKTKKAAAAADRLVKIAKSKVNKVNMDPELNHDVKQSSRY